jgi:hypothetical protein
MSWIYNNGAWWEPSGEGGPSAGRAIYWLGNVIAGLIVIFAIGDFFVSWAEGHPIVRFEPFIAAIVVCLIGRACRPLKLRG